MKSKLATLLILCMTLLLTSCAAMLGPRDIEIPQYKLQEALSKRFPFNNRYLELLDISFTNPRLALHPDTGRIAATLDAVASPPFLSKPWSGSLTLSGILQFDPSRNAIVLAEPRVDDFAFDGVDPSHSRQVAKISGILADQLLKDVPLYVFKPEDLRYGGSSFIPSKIVTKADSLVVTLVPAK
jgi:hypothetical protein